VFQAFKTKNANYLGGKIKYETLTENARHILSGNMVACDACTAAEVTCLELLSGDAGLVLDISPAIHQAGHLPQLAPLRICLHHVLQQCLNALISSLIIITIIIMIIKTTMIMTTITIFTRLFSS